jgi:hypothetical protein
LPPPPSARPASPQQQRARSHVLALLGRNLLSITLRIRLMRSPLLRAK